MTKQYGAITAFGVIVCLFISGCTSGEFESRKSAPFLFSQESSETNPELPELTESAGLSDYLAYAALNNPGLESVFNRWKAALQQVPQAATLPDPRFTYQYLIREVETRVGAQRQSFGIAQLFPWFGKLNLASDVAMQAANAARQRYEAAKLKLFFEVKDTYYEYYYLAKAVAITKENINLVKHLESVARNRFKTAAGTHPDVIRAQVEFGKLQDRLLTLLDLQEPIVARLNAAMNRPVNAEIPWPSQIKLEDVRITDKQLLTQLTEQNPEIKALDFKITQNKRSIELAKKDYFPDITLGLNFVDTDDSTVGNPRDNGKDPLIAMISVNIPLWREKYDAGVRQAQARYYSAIQNKAEKTNSLSAELKLIVYHFADAERKINLYRDTLLPKASESLKATQTGFQVGQSSFTDLIDAQRILLEFALAYERALANRSQSLAKLEMLVGREIPRTVNQSN